MVHMVVRIVERSFFFFGFGVFFFVADGGAAFFFAIDSFFLIFVEKQIQTLLGKFSYGWP